MLQLFRSFQWSGVIAFLALAALLRAPAFVLNIAVPSQLEHLGPWGAWMISLSEPTPFAWAFGAVLVVAVGLIASITLQAYRIGSAGAFPVLMALVIGSSAVWWLGFIPSLLATVLLALAAYRLFDGYRHQGAAMPGYDCGVLIGAAGLVSTPFFWFAVWAIIATTQLRKFRISEVFGLLTGMASLPVLVGIYAFVFGDFLAFRQNLFTGAVQFVDVLALADAWPVVTVLALTTGATIGAFQRLSTRRPIQEQRASQILYTMLPVGWVALFFSGIPPISGLALLLYPLSTLLGIWISELSRKRAQVVVLVLLAAIAAGLLWVGLSA